MTTLTTEDGLPILALTVRQFAAMTGDRSVWSVYRQIDRGELPEFRKHGGHWLIPTAAALEMFKQQT